MKAINTLKLRFSILALTSVTLIIQAQELKKVWETGGFDTPESVLSDISNDFYFISNIGGNNPTEKDGNGFISKVDTEGNIVTLKWVTGLNAPKGMVILGNQLLVTDIDRILGIELNSGKIISETNVEGAIFLNDMVVIDEKNVVISDSKTGTYYLFADGKVEKLISDENFKFPNGLALSEGEVISGIGDRLILISVKEKSWRDYITETGSVDGLSTVKKGTYLISDWSGHVHMVYTNKPKRLLLNTTEEKVNAADFYFDVNRSHLIIPTFFANTVACYKLEDI